MVFDIWVAETQTRTSRWLEGSAEEVDELSILEETLARTFRFYLNSSLFSKVY